MPRSEPGAVTRLPARAGSGEKAASDQLMVIVYEELRAIAAAYFAGEREHHTLQPTALVHEAFLRLADHEPAPFASRTQFFALAARVMRNVLVDHARARNREKRGGGWQRVTLDVADPGASDTCPLDLEALDQALARLAELDERKACLVELRFFGGLTSEEAADVLGIARSTAAEDWRLARAWLQRDLRDATP